MTHQRMNEDDEGRIDLLNIVKRLLYNYYWLAGGLFLGILVAGITLKFLPQVWQAGTTILIVSNKSESIQFEPISDIVVHSLSSAFLNTVYQISGVAASEADVDIERIRDSSYVKLNVKASTQTKAKKVAEVFVKLLNDRRMQMFDLYSQPIRAELTGVESSISSITEFKRKRYFSREPRVSLNKPSLSMGFEITDTDLVALHRRRVQLLTILAQSNLNKTPVSDEIWASGAPISPNPARIILIGAIAGLMLGAFLAVSYGRHH